MKDRLGLALFLLSAIVLLPNAECQDRRGQLQIVVWVFNRADVEDAAILAAEKTVDNIYRESGLGIVWRNRRPKAEKELQFEIRMDRIELVLNIEHQTRMFTVDTYGVAFPSDDNWGTVCDVFYDRVLESYRGGRASLERILGIVMAHELGHLLLGSNAHSTSGLMRSRWHYQDFLPANFAPTLSRQEMQKICTRLAGTRGIAGSLERRASP